jgi:CRISPR-associated protein Cmr6
MSDSQNDYHNAEEYNAALRLFKPPVQTDWSDREAFPFLYYSQEDYDEKVAKNKEYADEWNSKNPHRDPRRPRRVAFNVFDTKKDLIGKRFQSPVYDPSFLKRYCDRQSTAFKSVMGKLPFCQKSFVGTSRLIIGMGIESVFENHIQLHHIYGFPIIPASSIKGAVRNWTIFQYFEESEKAALKDPDFKHIFGDNNEDADEFYGRGKAIFGDAYPEGKVEIKSDIINVHYPDYYNKGKAPTDHQNPSVISYLTVDKGAEFQFLYGIKSGFELKGKLSKQVSGKVPSDKMSALEVLDFLLKETLEEWGIGAKTTSGMGRLIEKN